MADEKIIVVTGNEPADKPNFMKQFGIFLLVVIACSTASSVLTRELYKKHIRDIESELQNDAKTVLAESGGITIQIDSLEYTSTLLLSDIEELRCKFDSIEKAMADVTDEDLDIGRALDILRGE